MPAKSPEHAALGASLRARRQAVGLTLEDLGYRVDGSGMNPRYLSAIERGEINVSFSTLLRVCRALDVELSALAADFETRRR